MKVLRTPDERFENLPGYSFSANYVDVSLAKKSVKPASLTLMIHRSYVNEIAWFWNRIIQSV